MARTELPPQPGALIHSLRGFGYDIRTAVADLIDNSITAEASTVHVGFHWAGRDSCVSILDNGRGMDAATLCCAMTLGSRSPLDERSRTDLGRFGLGLKTASLSQCRRLVVASKPAAGSRSVLVWDLDLVDATNQWFVSDELQEGEADLLKPLDAAESGTLILWRALDRVVGDARSDDADARLHFQRAGRDVETHLGMIFHRFLDGARPRFRIYVNGATEEFRVRPWDPFVVAHPATQQFLDARRTIGGHVVALYGYVLPHKDRFEDPEACESAGGPSGWTNQEGFYVYRNERLVVPGGWLGLGRPRRWPKDEQHKLARIRLDVPTSLDHRWKVDVKKSTASPPFELREWLTRNAERVRGEAREVFVHRGNRASARTQAEFCPAWFAESGASPRYRINRKHPAIASLLDDGDDVKARFERALRLLETTVPVHRIWLDVSEKPDVPRPTREQLEIEEVMRVGKDLISRFMSGLSMSREAAVRRLGSIEPFDQYPEVISALENT